MKIKKVAMLLALGAISVSAYAQAQAEKPYLRSSIYTVLLKSDAENAKLDREIEDPNLVTSMISGFKDSFKDLNPFKKNKKEDEAAKEEDEVPPPTTIRSRIPQEQFPSIPIPDHFNDHNLPVRVIDLDPLFVGLTQEEIETAGASFEKKKSKMGGIMKGIGKGAASMLGGKDGESAIINIDTVSSQIPAALEKYFAANHTAADLVAKWFDYDPNRSNKWDLNLISDRGFYNASAQAINDAQMGGSTSILAQDGFSLIDKTFVIGINLRFRSNKAIMAEAQMIADAAASMAGSYGVLASQVAGAVTSMAVGNGYSVQANSYLYKLEWNDEIQDYFANNIFDKNASLEDLINSGMCRLIPMGKAKESARVRQSITNSRPESELVRIATAQAIDKAINKLQEKVEDFRTFTRITGMGENGIVYAKIGTKEGLEKNDEYEILEEQLNPKTNRIEYKSVGTVKVVDKQIWENRAGIAQDINDISDEEAKADGINKEAIALGQTAFKGAKKGNDYTGYLLRLKKKK